MHKSQDKVKELINSFPLLSDVPVQKFFSDPRSQIEPYVLLLWSLIMGSLRETEMTPVWRILGGPTREDLEWAFKIVI